MQFKVKPYGKEYRFDQESDITEVFYTYSGLRIVVVAATSMFSNILLEIYFSNTRGFRFLDEGDLIAYWETKAFNTNHHVYEILSGGWSNGEKLQEDILDVSIGFEVNEWFIATTNCCMNVLSGTEPRIAEIMEGVRKI